ncbi:MAG: hypothetical protein RL022_2308, partial [Chloroflexota bacterium]
MGEVDHPEAYWLVTNISGWVGKEFSVTVVCDCGSSVVLYVDMVHDLSVARNYFDGVASSLSNLPCVGTKPA